MRWWRTFLGILAFGLALWGCGDSTGGGRSGDASSPGDGGGMGLDSDSGDNDACVSTCTDEGARQCSAMATKVKVCRDVGGCLRWVVAEDCATQGKLCDDSQDPPVCVAPPSCDDGILNQDETDVDCGGSCDPCAAGSQCRTGQDCQSGVCQSGVCLVCPPGRYRCSGNSLEQCASDGSAWGLIQHCDPTAGTGCDAAAGACQSLPPIGNGPDSPTGEYYQFAHFTTHDSSFLGGADVDSLDDYIFVNRDGSHVDVYQVTLLDSDGDGKLEPNQHPDNPDNQGPIEERVLTYVQTYDVPIGNKHNNELYVTATNIAFTRGQHEQGAVFSYDIATQTVTTVIPTGGGLWSQVLGFDEVAGVWYTATPYDRKVYSYDAVAGEWVWEFTYPNLSGDHNDGLEVVTDPNTGVPYVYVSDMTSDFLAQYVQDEFGVWTQVNLFQYSQPSGDAVEGMGFGALNHFWVTNDGYGSGIQALYEIGGGDLAQYTEPFDPTHQ